MRRNEEILGLDASDRTSKSVVGLYRISKCFLRAASGFDRRGRVGNLETLALDLIAEGFDLVRVSFQRLGSRVSVWDRRETRV